LASPLGLRELIEKEKWVALHVPLLSLMDVLGAPITSLRSRSWSLINWMHWQCRIGITYRWRTTLLRLSILWHNDSLFSNI
jgi:hypothetical protein